MPPARTEPAFPKPPEQKATQAQIDAGEVIFIAQCTRCHQLGPSTTPDLRTLNDGLHVAFKDILLRGALAPAGMERFNDILSDKDADNVHAYLIEQSWIAYRAQESAAAHK
jgi:quinohemoprotein ethanol dehydrogenase